MHSTIGGMMPVICNSDTPLRPLGSIQGVEISTIIQSVVERYDC